MSFNDQVNSMKSRTGGYSVFKDGVKTKWMTGDNAILFRILPAYNYNDKDAAGNINPAGWVPYREPNDNLTAWGGLVHIARYVGHGTGKGSSRRDFLSPLTFGESDSTFCPITTLYRTAAAYPEWQYLVEDRRDANKRVIERGAIVRPAEFLCMNIMELTGGAIPEVVLGIMTKSATDALVSPHKNGLLFQPNANATPESIQQNYMTKWAAGDITDPNYGPVLYLTKAKDRGEFSGYQVGLSETPQRQIRRYPVPAEMLYQRYDLSNLRHLLELKADEDVIKELVAAFCMRSPGGHHEYELLKLAFGQMFRIPDAPAAPAATASVPGGWGPGTAAPTVPIGPAIGPVGPVGPAAGPVGPVGPAVGPVAPAVGFPTAPAAAAPINTGFPAPAGYAGPTTAPGVAQAATQSAAGVAPAAAPVAPATPAAPGDPVGNFDREQFLSQLRKTRSGVAGPQPK